jgi:predicted membrane protein
MSIEAAGYITAKIASAAGGLFGGLVMIALMKPKSILDATLRGGVCTGSAIIGSPVLIEYLGYFSPNMDHFMFAGAVIGFLSWGVLSMTARFFIKAEATNTDIVEAVKDIKK